MICSSAAAELCAVADHLALLAGEVALGEHLEHAGHADHRGADLVRHGGEERRLGLAGVLGGLARLDGDLLGLLAGRDVGLDRRRHRVEGAGDPLELRHARDRRRARRSRRRRSAGWRR